MPLTAHSAPIQAKDIDVGTLLWYSGSSALDTWNCPAIIYRVTANKKYFYVMSLDDMCKQDQQYALDMNEDPSPSRQNMRLASVAEVDAYLAKRGAKKNARQIIARVQTCLNKKAK